MAPITSDMVVAGKGNRANKSSSSLFDPGQVGSVADSPQLGGPHGVVSSADVSTEPGATSPVPEFTSVGPPDGSPASLDIMVTVSDGAPGTVNEAESHAASGNDAGSEYPPTVTSATFPDMRGDRGNNRGAHIAGVDPDA
jgi:hypothetical protein